MTALTTVNVSIASPIDDLDAQLVAAVGPDTAEVGTSNLFFIAKNADASAKTVTIATPGAVDGLAIADVARTIAANDYAIIPLAMIFRGSTGRATITYSAVTSVTVGVFRLVM